MSTDFEELFDDIMFYAKKKLGGKDFESKEELEEYIRDSDPQKKIKHWVRKEIIDTNNAAKTITEPIKKDKLVEKAIKAELQRNKRARSADEAITAKKVKTLNAEHFKQWKKNPARFDLRGIDTKTHNLIAQEINRRLRTAKSKGYKVGVKGNEPFRKEVGEKRRSLITGRFIKK